MVDVVALADLAGAFISTQEPRTDLSLLVFGEFRLSAKPDASFSCRRPSLTRRVIRSR